MLTFRGENPNKWNQYFLLSVIEIDPTQSKLNTNTCSVRKIQATSLNCHALERTVAQSTQNHHIESLLRYAPMQRAENL